MSICAKNRQNNFKYQCKVILLHPNRWPLLHQIGHFPIKSLYYEKVFFCHPLALSSPYGIVWKEIGRGDFRGTEEWSGACAQQVLLPGGNAHRKQIVLYGYRQQWQPTRFHQR